MMDKMQIDTLMKDLQRSHGYVPELLETHISWVIICRHHVFKIKKPVRFSFVDFSTLEKRKYYCEREILLNRRLADGIYIDVQSVRILKKRFVMGGEYGEIIDYAVWMHRVDNSRQMDKLLLLQQVTEHDIRQLARKIAAFHQQAELVASKNLTALRFDFNDINSEREFLSEKLGENAAHLIIRGIAASDLFLGKNIFLIARRLELGFFRDCHGDLHSGNIFLLDEPQPFDCLEFNDELRRIDVLDEVAFLCMDLEAHNRKHLADLFLTEYNNLFPAIRNQEDAQLLTYYKSYRANIRAKVCSIRARSSSDKTALQNNLAACRKYLLLMDEYLQTLTTY